MKMNLTHVFTAISIFAVFFISGCSDNTLSIKSDYKSIPYDKLKSYRWYDKAQPAVNSNVPDTTLRYIKKTIDKNLTGKSLSLQTDGDVDFLVNISVTTRDHVDLKESITYSGTAPGYSWTPTDGFQREKYIVPQTEYIYHRDGTLVIDMIDFSSDKLIWRGIAEKRLTKELSQRQTEDLIEKAISAVLANFPPKSGIKSDNIE